MWLYLHYDSVFIGSNETGRRGLSAQVRMLTAGNSTFSQLHMFHTVFIFQRGRDCCHTTKEMLLLIEKPELYLFGGF